MKKTLLLILIFSAFFTLGQTNQPRAGDYKQEISSLQNEVKVMEKEINDLNLKTSNLNVEIVNLKKAHDEQVEFYKSTQQTIIWIVSIVFLILSGIFTAFIWVFKKPEQIWKGLITKEKDAKRLLDRLESQHQHQKLLFILGDKGLFDYNADDWNIINAISKSSELKPSKERTEYDWFFIGLSSYKQKDYKKSIRSYLKAIEIDDDFEVAYKNLANAYDEDGDFKNAIKTNKKVIEINPNSDKAYNNLGILYGDTTDDSVKTIECFIKAIKLKPSCGYYYTNLFEHCLVNDLPFDEKIEDAFVSKFKEQRLVFSVYQMLSAYRNIAEGKDYKEQLDNWNKVYYTIGSGENFRTIENWIDKKEEGNIKEGLKKAIMFFKEYQEI